MNKELRELLEQINNKKEEAKGFYNEGKIEEAKALRDEISTLQNKFDVAKDLFDQEKEDISNKAPEQTKTNAISNFIAGVKTKFQNGMSEGVAVDGGYVVPQDIETKINELRERKDALQNLVTVEPVSTLSGSRVFKTRAQQTGFAKVAEGGTITEKATPKFTNLPYSVEKYAGFMKATNELFADSDQAIQSTLERWIGDESRVTRNKAVLAELDKKAKTAIVNVDDIKSSLNVQLDPAFHGTAVIVVNQDSFNWLDTQKDDNGNYLLQPSVSSPTGKQLFGKDVHMFSNKDLPTVDDAGTFKAPVIIGDLKEAVVLFDRKQTDIKVSDVAMDAYETDVTLFRAIERFVVKTRDAEAFIYGQVQVV